MILGIDVGGTNIKYGIFDSNLELKNKYSIDTEAEKGPKSIIDKIVKIIKENDICDEIGIGFPSVVTENGYIHISPNMKDFVNIDLKKELEFSTNRKIVIDNDANVAALSELYLGNAKNLNNFIYITLGTGIGGAIIINRRLFKGDNFGAGEIGYSVIDFNSDSKITSNRFGILEEEIGTPAFLKYYQNLGGDKNDTIQLISKKCDSNNSIAKKAFEFYGETLGFGLGSIMNFLDINSVVIGGGVSNCSEVMYDTLNFTLNKRLLPQLVNNFKIYKAHFLENAGIYGAATLTKYNHEYTN